MQNSDSSLLARYVQLGEEDAFAELIRRHLNLVYSAALRQLEDLESAREVTQTVFLTVARKARKLQGHPTLTGWLYASTYKEAAHLRRSEHRRRVRETAFHAMGENTGEEVELEWSALRPILDDAMNELPPLDREAVLWRFFDSRPFKDIGALLGLSENAARMRVQRALDRLRTVLSQRGVSYSAASLGVILSQRAVAAAPADMAGRIVQQISARRNPAASSTFTARSVRWREWTLPISAILTVSLATLGWLARRVPDADSSPGSISADRAQRVAGNESVVAAVAPDLTGSEAALQAGVNPGFANGSLLTLHFVTRDSGKPVPSVLVNYRGWTQFSWSGVVQGSFIATRDGRAVIRVVPDPLRLQLTSQAEGFADTRLTWHPPNGEHIPTNQIVELDRAAALGGRVVDSEGQPIEGAKVEFSHRELGPDRKGIESHEFGSISTQTDADGRWRLARIAADMLDKTEAEATHPDHLPSSRRSMAESETQLAMRNQSHVFRLTRGTSLTGVVADSAGERLEGAIVRLNQVAGRKTQTTPTGEFTLSGCPTGEHWLLVEASGYAPATLPVRIEVGGDPVQVTLMPAQVLRIRVVNPVGAPVTNAWFTLSMNQAIGQTNVSLAPPTTPTEFLGFTDLEGKGEWSNAPAGIHQFLVGAVGYQDLKKISLAADGSEHRIVLEPAINLAIQGRVTDAVTGKPIPVFRLAFGWPEWDPINNRTNARFGSSDMEWVRFQGGQYQHQFRSAPLERMQDPQVMIKCEVPEYQSFLSPPIRLNAGLVTLDMELSKSKVLQLTVLDPEGSAAAGAEIGLVRRGDRLHLNGTQISRGRGEDPELLRQADARGMLTLATDASVASILAVHPHGFARTTFEALEADPYLRLQPWGRIEGEFSQDDPEANFTWIRAPSEGAKDLDIDLAAAILKADPHRRFAYPQVAPGDWIVSQVRPVVIATGETSSMPGQSRSVSLSAGEIVQIHFGGGCRVVGKVALPDDLSTLSSRIRWFGQISSGQPIPPDEILGDQEAIQHWRQQPEIQAQLKVAKSRVVVVAADGRFVLDSVEPGEYQLGLRLSFPQPQSGGGVQPAPRPSVRISHTFVVPEESEGTLIDLGLLSAQSFPSATAGKP